MDVPSTAPGRLNPREAALVARKVRALFDAGARPEDVAVIAPYAA